MKWMKSATRRMEKNTHALRNGRDRKKTKGMKRMQPDEKGGEEDETDATIRKRRMKRIKWKKSAMRRMEKNMVEGIQDERANTHAPITSPSFSNSA